MIAWAVTNWDEFEGHMTMNGVDAAALPFPRLINLIYAHLMANRDEKSRQRLLSQLDMPMGPNDDGEGGVWGPQAQAENFAKAQEQFEEAFG